MTIRQYLRVNIKVSDRHLSERSTDSRTEYAGDDIDNTDHDDTLYRPREYAKEERPGVEFFPCGEVEIGRGGHDGGDSPP